jgi:hypothetical protein
VTDEIFNCPFCSAANPQGAEVCSNCGKRIADTEWMEDVSDEGATELGVPADVTIDAPAESFEPPPADVTIAPNPYRRAASLMSRSTRLMASTRRFPLRCPRRLNRSSRRALRLPAAI